MKQLQKVYVPIPVSERLPEKDGYYFILIGEHQHLMYFYSAAQEFRGSTTFALTIPTHWLEEKMAVVMSQEELIEFAQKWFHKAKEEYAVFGPLHDRDIANIELDVRKEIAGS